tara:strand:+ start:1476 stop:1826 length:351 start_codon:yes stop_codon:yes gene_type:complete
MDEQILQRFTLAYPENFKKGGSLEETFPIDGYEKIREEIGMDFKVRGYSTIFSRELVKVGVPKDILVFGNSENMFRVFDDVVLSRGILYGPEESYAIDSGTEDPETGAGIVALVRK